ncbi:hypothetical protein ABK040_003118 [Willaertia magna]
MSNFFQDDDLINNNTDQQQHPLSQPNFNRKINKQPLLKSSKLFTLNDEEEEENDKPEILNNNNEITCKPVSEKKEKETKKEELNDNKNDNETITTIPLLLDSTGTDNNSKKEEYFKDELLINKKNELIIQEEEEVDVTYHPLNSMNINIDNNNNKKTIIQLDNNNYDNDQNVFEEILLTDNNQNKNNHQSTKLKIYLEQEIEETIGEIGSFIGKNFSDIISSFYTPDFLEEEMIGISEMTNDLIGLTFDLIYQLNLGYSFLAHCTSIALEEEEAVMQREEEEEGNNNGINYRKGVEGVFHLRNFDWDEKISTIFRELTVDIDFMVGDRYLFRTTTVVGFVGIFTAMRFKFLQPLQSQSIYQQLLQNNLQNNNLDENNLQNNNIGYSLSLNYRKTNEIFGSFVNWLSGFFNNWPIEFLLRKVLQECSTFEQAIEMIKDNYTISPFYLLICSSNNSILLTRNRTDEEKRLVLHQRNVNVMRNVELEESCKRRFIVQTNIDFWKDTIDPDWAGKDLLLWSSLKRKEKAEMYFKRNNPCLVNESEDDKEGNVNLWRMVEYCWNCLNQRPILNKETIYQVVMNVEQGLYFSRLYYPYNKKN